MARLLIVYGSEEGQTAKVARHMADLFRTQHHVVDLVHGRNMPPHLALDGYDGVIVGASIHMGRHQRYMVAFGEQYRDALTAKLSAFFTVCLTAKSDAPADRAQVEQYVQDYITATNWYPDQVAVFAGALQYSKYGLIKRFLMKQISKQSGGDTDTAHDYEYTDWTSVDDFAETFLVAVEGTPVLAAD
jgi:menaquinone-dependent protoporphyrinogen oxidase